MRYRQQKSKRGLITILSIAIVLINSLFGGSIVKALSNTSNIDTINVLDVGSITIDIEDADVKSRIENMINETIKEIKLENRQELDNLLDDYINSSRQVEFIDKDEIKVETSFDIVKHELNEYILINKLKEEEIIREQEDREREEREAKLILEKKEKLWKDKQQKEIEEERRKHTRKQNSINASRSTNSRDLYTITCYDLSVQSTGKRIGDKWHGITANGTDLKGHTWETARAVAVDPRKIPLGTKLQVTFTNEKYSKYNGVYKAVDVGGAIKGNKLDFFLGDFGQNEAHPSVWEFGKTQAVVKILD